MNRKEPHWIRIELDPNAENGFWGTLDIDLNLIERITFIRDPERSNVNTAVSAIVAYPMTPPFSVSGETAQALKTQWDAFCERKFTQAPIPKPIIQSAKRIPGMKGLVN